jgi:hypothetical protein
MRKNGFIERGDLVLSIKIRCNPVNKNSVENRCCGREVAHRRILENAGQKRDSREKNIAIFCLTPA